ncbi:hypothetical protein JNO04_07140 [Halomonas sp. MC140]|nr:hypothetical protein [Halomonas sp. MC140]MDN7132125.1 hypothetical protein [Halomonas sp. MC140]
MLLKKLGKKAAIVGISFGLVASPLAMAHPSIELNKDRSVGQDIIDKPQSQMSDDAQVSPRDLTRDEGDSLDFSPSSSTSDTGKSARRGTQYSPEDLTRDEGDSIDW